MATPRIFVSSTFYDLRYVRADLERFLKEMGYEAILHERGSIPYGREEGLEEYAYREVELCEILVAIIGGRFGTRASDDEYSISQRELKTALRLGKQVHVFVEKSVLNEYQTWELNQESEIRWASVDDVKIFQFLLELHSLPRNNPIQGFETTGDIITFLKGQWAGLFQRYLASAASPDETRLAERLSGSVSTLERLVRLLSEHQESRSDVVRSILLMEHPAFQALRSKLSLNFTLRFYTFEELEEVLAASNFSQHSDEDSEDYDQWSRPLRREGQRLQTQYVMVQKALFEENGDLRAIQPGAWEEEMLKVLIVTPRSEPDDDLPF